MSLNPGLTLTIRHDNIAIICIDLPGEKVNTLQASCIPLLQSIIEQIKQNKALVAVIILSGKADNFIVGADIRMIDECQSVEQAQALSSAGQTVFNALAALPIPVLALIQGECLGGGLELALACHYRLASDHPKTSFALPEVKLGLLPGTGGTVRLPELIGIKQALPLLLTGKTLSGKQALKIGLIDGVVSKEALIEQAVAFISKKTAKRSTTTNWFSRIIHLEPFYQGLLTFALRRAEAVARNNYPAIREMIDLLRVRDPEKRMRLESEAFARLGMNTVSAALRSIFLRTTALKREIATEKQSAMVQRAAVVGGGIMGGGIASLIAMKMPVPVRVKEVNNNALAHVFQFQQRQYAKLQHIQRRKGLENEKPVPILTGDTEWRGFNKSDLVIEAVAENLELKQQMLAEIEQRCSTETVFASNTSSLQIEKIAEKAQYPERVIGLHFFNPVEKMPLVEVIPHEGTSATVVQMMMQFALKLGKIPIQVADKPGFFINRILTPWLNEALHCLMEGSGIEQIDNALIDAGYPLGPCQLLDEIGLDTAAKIAPLLTSAYGERFSPPAAIGKLMAQDFRGKKNQRGFYHYSNKRGKIERGKANPAIYAILQLTPNNKRASAEIAERCSLLMLNEAQRCLQENVIKSSAEGDLAAIYGLGFPPFTGGPYSMIASMGESLFVQRLQALQKRYGDRFKPWSA